ncbi:MAG TPA: D-alanyl-D-alanine carboxypeptidase/D-alanyl-D-alanine-endopeptidase, partial [Gemmatimonadales bacterium]|nr:D-alanyl-D-alanine carboxypeptidase/D-alanyl-D-alanine-endopeptidase [Gemmatimonadales bacterium]
MSFIVLRHIPQPTIRRAALMAALLSSAAPALAAQSLARRLDRLMDAPPFDRHHWGLVVLDTTGKILYQRNGARLFVPASNTKLVVSALAASRLPADFTVMTSVYPAGPVIEGRVHGDLVLYGRGDPTMSRRCFDADTTRTGVCEADPMRRLRELAGAVRDRGIRVIEGSLIGDGSFFEPEMVHGTWEADDLVWWYAAPVTGLAFNDNSLDLSWGGGPEAGAPGRLSIAPDFGDVTVENRTVTTAAGGGIDAGRLAGSGFWVAGQIPRDRPSRTSYLAMADPNRYAASAFRRALAEAGIAVLGATESTTDSLRYAAARANPALAETSSRPLREWLPPILGPSQNLFAELLLKQVARHATGEGSWRAGLELARRFLIDTVGADSTQFSFRDGSGLSRANVASPLTFARLLLWIRRRPEFAIFGPALPVAGRSGTIRTRMVGTQVEGRVQAKTGTVFRTNSLSGYVTLPNGRIRIFSILTNNHDLSNG